MQLLPELQRQLTFLGEQHRLLHQSDDLAVLLQVRGALQVQEVPDAQLEVYDQGLHY